MSLDLSAATTLPAAVETTLSGTPDELSPILFPSDVGKRLVSIYCVEADCYWTLAESGGVKLPIPSGQWVELPRLQAGIWIGSTTASVLVKVLLEEWR